MPVTPIDQRQVHTVHHHMRSKSVGNNLDAAWLCGCGAELCGHGVWKAGWSEACCNLVSGHPGPCRNTFQEGPRVPGS
jgi:hypothetical protein